MNTHYLGIDISKATLDCCLLQSNSQQQTYNTYQHPNTPAGHRALIKALGKHNPIHIILEATGVYSQAIHNALHHAGYKTSLLNPRLIKNYARSHNLRAKTDRIDAQLLARYGAERTPEATVPKTAEHQQLQSHINELDAIIGERQRVSNRIESTPDKPTRALQKKHQAILDKHIQQIEKRILSLIKNDPVSNNNLQLLLTIPGIATRSATRILSHLAGKTFPSARALAAHAGLTPTIHQSGSSINKPPRLSKIGNARLRRALYMPALVALRYNKPLQPWITQLKDKNKPKKTIIAAIMRKLLHLIFGILKHNQPFNPSLASSFH